MDNAKYQHEQREMFIDELSDLDLTPYTDKQLFRLAKALENALDDVETEAMRRDDPPLDLY